MAVPEREPPPARRSPSSVSAIRTVGLTKRYGDRLVVEDLSFEVPSGVVAGFIGANGAGKTTTIRMLLGLVRATSGSAHMLGVPCTNPAGYLPFVGALVEAPVLYPSLSGRRNLEVLAVLGGYPRLRVDAVLETVGLTDRAEDHANHYSLGMKQRLGIAGALLPDPRLLVLDEPTNGLDPPGILEMRALVRSLADAGTTVFVSSHLLAEVEHMADHLVMIDGGRLVVDGPLDEILARQRAELVVAPEHDSDLPAVARLAVEAGHAVRVIDGRVHVDDPGDLAAHLNRISARAGITLVELREERPSLEDTFLSLTHAGVGPAVQVDGSADLPLPRPPR